METLRNRPKQKADPELVAGLLLGCAIVIGIPMLIAILNVVSEVSRFGWPA